MKITHQTKLPQLAAIVCSRLSKRGIEAVLTGGAVVTIYSGSAYVSHDLDFITHADHKRIQAVMEELGFVKDADRYFRHPDTEFFVEFPSPPLAIGSEPVKTWATKHSKFGTLFLLGPTHCVMDRLSAFYHWNDRESLEQALLVAVKQKIDLDKIRQWSKNEGKADRYNIFLKELKKKSAA